MTEKLNRRILSAAMAALLAVVTVFAFSSSRSYAAVSSPPEIAAWGAVVMDADTGDILYSKNADSPFYPASTTKIMTALLAIENLDWDQKITADWRAPDAGGSNLEVKAGETFTTEQLVYGMMLHSANDMAVALAVAVSGSVENFADLMNRRAAEIGCTNTHFVTPNGMPNDQHVTSAHDLALIAREAMKNKKFARVVSTVRYTIPATNMHEARKVKNSNYMLYKKSEVDVDGVKIPYKYEGCKGIKTGYTNAAQGCLVEEVERNGLDLISVVMHSEDDMRYPDTIKLMDWAFANYGADTLLHKGQQTEGVCQIDEGTADTVGAVPAEDVSVYAERTSSGIGKAKGKFDFKVKDLKKFTAPVKKGQYAGRLEVFRDGKQIGEYRLVAAENVDQSFIYKIISWFR